VASTGCGCGLSASSSSFALVFTARGCGASTSRTTAGYPLTSSACGCGDAVALVHPLALVKSEGCGCGDAVSHVSIAGGLLAIARGCGASTSRTTAGYPLTSSACGCGDTEVLVHPLTLVKSEGCGCGDTAGTTQEIACYVTACGCGGASVVVSTGSVLLPGCPNPIPRTLYLAVEGADDCSCLNFAGPIVYDDAQDAWVGETFAGCQGRTLHWYFWCQRNPVEWLLSNEWPISVVPTAIDCEAATFSGTDYPAGFACNSTFSFTVSP
jgi:hypothetical protein